MSRHVHLHSHAPVFQPSSFAAHREVDSSAMPLFISSTPLAHSAPTDQAAGLRRLFAQRQVRFVPVASNPHVAFAGALLERLCAGFAEQGAHTLVVDASEHAAPADGFESATLADRIDVPSHGVSVLSARGLPLRYLDSHGCTTGFLDAVSAAAPRADVVLVHASATDLCRMFMRFYGRCEHTDRPRPLLLADDHPASVTHAYAAMKLLTHRAGLLVHDLLLCAADASPRGERIAMQLATCGDDFLGAVLRDWMQMDPSSDAQRDTDGGGCGAVAPALRRWVRDTLKPDPIRNGSVPHTPPPAALHTASSAPRASALN
jgi:hypothetical protein